MRSLAIFLIVSFSAVQTAAQNGLDSARKLYAAAEYESALTTLTRLRTDAENGSGLEIDRYRVLCLFALGRANEASAIIDAIVVEHPFETTPADDVPPRIQTAFVDARRRLLPGIARGLYAEGKAAFDRKAFPEAIGKLEQTMRILSAPEAANQAELGDLKTLATGFLELSKASLPPPVPVVEPSAPPASASTPASVDPVAAPSSATDAPARESSTGPLTEPVVISQQLPPWTTALGGALFEAEFRGAIEIDIDEAGAVVGARIVQAIHPAYDPILLRAARDWKYQPARRAGQPIRITKRVEVVLRPR